MISFKGLTKVSLVLALCFTFAGVGNSADFYCGESTSSLSPCVHGSDWLKWSERYRNEWEQNDREISGRNEREARAREREAREREAREEWEREEREARAREREWLKLKELEESIKHRHEWLKDQERKEQEILEFMKRHWQR